MDAPAKTNFRQVGTCTGGALLRGAAVRQQPPPDPHMRVSSIPSKYETVLHREANERNAFGIRTQRFSDGENDLPGPGSYYKPPSLLKTQADSGSVSKLGYSTGFVSKAKRFGDRIRDPVPGPGQYQENRSIVERKPHNKRHSSSSFAIPSRSSNQFASGGGGSLPGPGEYNVTQSSSAISHNIARSAFSSKTTRGFEPSKDVPAPGQYDDPIQLGRGGRSPQSIFKSTVARLDNPDPSKLPPGPGAYKAEEAEATLRYDYIARSHTSAVFQKGNNDRFGRHPTKKSGESDVGPGSYNVALPLTDLGTIVHKPGAASAFKSSTARGGEFAGQSRSDLPGPASYNPSSPDKRSHILNSNKKWL